MVDLLHPIGEDDLHPDDIGPVIPDPWDDPKQVDWPLNPDPTLPAQEG